jgi:hypothetical protein
LVRAEAAWHLAGKRSREPDLTFFMLDIHMSNYLTISGRRDYDLALVERILARVQQHPLYAGMDLEAYWSTLEPP